MADGDRVRSRRRAGVMCRAVAFLLCSGLACSAAAEVRLSTYVHKVESVPDARGVVQQQMVEADSVVPGDELRYTITFTNTGDAPVDAGSIVITNPLPEDTRYVPGSATGDDTEITFSNDGETFVPSDDVMSAAGGPGLGPDAESAIEPTIRWLYQDELEPGESSSVSFSLVLAPQQ